MFHCLSINVFVSVSECVFICVLQTVKHTFIYRKVVGLSRTLFSKGNQPLNGICLFVLFFVIVVGVIRVFIIIRIWLSTISNI